MKLAELAAKLAGFVGARVLGAAVGFLSQLVLARTLSAHDVGIVAMGMSAASFLSLVANGGYALLATTELPKMSAHRAAARASDSFNTVALVDSVLVALGLVLFILALAQTNLFTEGQRIAVFAGLVCAPASLAIRYNASLAMAARRFKAAYMPDFLLRPTALLTGLLATFVAGVLHGAPAALVVFVAVTYITAVAQAWVLPSERLGLRHLAWPRRSLARALRTRAFALTLVSATLLAFADLVILVAGLLFPEADVAVVGVAMRLAAIAGFVLQAGQMLVNTDFTQALTRNDDQQVSQILRRLTFITLAIVVAGLLATVVFGSYALGLFGEVYRGGAGVLVLFMVGQSLRALGGMNQQVLSIHGFQVRTAGACALAVVVLVLLAVLLKPQLGIMAMGWAVVGAEAVWLVALAAQAKSLCGRRADAMWVLLRR